MKFTIELYTDTNHPCEKHGVQKETFVIEAMDKTDAIRLLKWKKPQLKEGRFYIYSPEEMKEHNTYEYFKTIKYE